MTQEIDFLTRLANARFVASLPASEDWSAQPRVVWDGATLERELDELFPVEAGLEALRRLKEAEAASK